MKSILNITRSCIRRFSASITCNVHTYEELYPWSNLKQFSEYLAKNVIYNEDGLVIMNKPYGVGLSSPTNKSENFRFPDKTSYTAFDHHYYLTDALPYVAEYLNCDSLKIVKTPGRFTSGITILSTSDKVIDKINTCMRKAKGQQQLCQFYWAVVRGNPQPSSDSLKLGLQLKENPHMKGEKKPVVLQKWTNNAVKRGEVKVFKVEHHTLYKQKEASLVEISSSATKWNFLCVYMAHVLSPVLGDQLYGSRVQHLMDVPLLIEPFSDAARGPKKLSQSLLSALRLQPGQEKRIPVHIHLRKLILPNYLGKDRDFIIEAPPPQSFQWSCEVLGLKYIDTTEELNCSVNL